MHDLKKARSSFGMGAFFCAGFCTLNGSEQTWSSLVYLRFASASPAAM
jgi:hypothetical protein